MNCVTHENSMTYVYDQNTLRRKLHEADITSNMPEAALSYMSTAS